MEAMKFGQLEYIGAFAFASGIAILFVQLYISNVKARIKDLKEARDKAMEINTELVGVLKSQSKVISQYTEMKEVVQDLSKRVTRLEG